MSSKDAKETLTVMLSLAGIKINGDADWDIQVIDDRFYEKVLNQGSLGLGESYMYDWWCCKRIDEMVFRILRAKVNQRLRLNWRQVLGVLKAKLFNRQSKLRASQVAEKHYDLDQDIFEHMLDRRMCYSCAYWNGASTLNEAQENKLSLICRKLQMDSGMKILDIGCGWGSLLQREA